MDTEQLPDNNEESESEEEPLLKTQKTVTINTTQHQTSQPENQPEQTPEETGKTATSKANKKSNSLRKKSKEKKKRTTAVVSGARSRNPFNCIMYACISLNTNGIAGKGKRDTIFDFLEQCRADIILLQETHNDSKDNENLWTHEWGGMAIWNTGSNRSRGTAILFRPGFNPVLSNCLRDHVGRVIAVKAIINGTEINIMNIYAPNIPNERKDFFENLWHFKPGNENLILAGDFNCIDDLDFDKQGGNPLSGNVGVTELKDFLENNSLQDTWGATNPEVRIYTWSNNDFTLRSRLDKWYITMKLHKTATSCIRACPHSDHSVVEVTINPDNNNIRGKGVWKFNNELLKDKAFQREIRGFQMFWKDKKKDSSNIHEWWDEAKLQYKERAVKQSVKKSRNRWKQEDSLIQKITDLKTPHIRTKTESTCLSNI